MYRIVCHIATPGRSTYAIDKPWPMSRCLFCAVLVCTSWLLTGAKAKSGPTVEPVHALETKTTYELGADDRVVLSGIDMDDIAGKPVRIGLDGTVNLPMIGRVAAAGLTVPQLERELRKRLSVFVKDPQISILITEYRSQPVSVVGAVNSPGVHQLQGRKTLLELLSSAGGIRQDAGYSVRVTRRAEWGPIPLPGAKTGPDGFSVAAISLPAILSAESPGENISIKPHDVISVPRAQLIYVIGKVRKSGGFALGENQTLTALQALALADGLDATAAPKRAKIMRAAGSSGRTEIAVDVQRILAGKAKDVPLHGDDILYIPSNGAKTAAIKALNLALQTGSGVVVWRSARP